MLINELLGTRWPIIQAPMAGVQGSGLAVAVSDCGALGSVPAALLDAQALRSELAGLRERTARPVNVNFFCHQPPRADPARTAAWSARLAPYFAEFRIDPQLSVDVPVRRPFGAEVAAVLEELPPAVVSFHFGLPEPALLARVRATGARILASATTVEEALWLESRGVDAIIAQGWEAGGHRSMFLSDDVSAQPALALLLPQVVNAVRVPVIAAGGIADATDVAAALKAGAAAVQVGSAYLLCPEATTSRLHRKVLQSDAGAYTAITNVFTGRPARGIVNRLVRELGPMNPAAPAFPLAAVPLAALRAHQEHAGNADFSPLWAGTNTRRCREVAAAVVTRALAGER